MEYDLQYLVVILRKRSLMTAEQTKQALANAAGVRERLKAKIEATESWDSGQYTISPAEILVEMNFQSADGKTLDEDVIMSVIADAAQIRFVKPDPLDLDSELIVQTLSRRYARRNTCVPLGMDEGKILIAVDNPFRKAFFEDLRNHLASEIEFVLSSKSDILRIITEVYGFRQSIRAAEEDVRQRVDLGNVEQLVELQSVSAIEATDRPIINAVEYLLHYAFTERASDIHIEPKRDRSDVRLRIDGILHTVYSFPKVVHPALVSRIKMLARMDISEKRRPQDGRIKTREEAREVELRVSSLPVAFGEKMVLRVFDPEELLQALETVGLYSDVLAGWRGLVTSPTGLVLVTGPTGSGKTTTLYSTLQELADSTVNITTIEDPLEMVYEEFNQVLVQRRVDVTFGSALRTVLRQDPDVIMVGEIRDEETAKMANQAALTGHLVLSTMHTNDTSSTVTRLLDLGVEPFLLSTTLLGVMAQRLVRNICSSCRREEALTQEQMEALGIELPPGSTQALPVSLGDGCIRCRSTGYYGRTGVFELMSMDETLRRLIVRGASAPEIRKAARAEGMMSLRECGIRKMAQGKTSFEEVLRLGYVDG